MTRHTPAPWLFEDNGEGFFDITSHDEAIQVGEVFDIDDARLIAAAPDLLSDLTELGEAIEKGCPELIAWRWISAKKTINKVKGVN